MSEPADPCEDSRWPRWSHKVSAWLRVPTEEHDPTEGVTPPSPPPACFAALVERIQEDIQTVLQHDPAARSMLEVVLVYPGLHAIWTHRVSHALWRKGFVLAPRVLSHLSRMATGVEIHPGAVVGRRVFIDHGSGVVVGETARIGDGCLLYQGVTLGGTSLERRRRHPTLGANVVVGTHASVLGDITLGDGARVGSGSVVIRPVPPGATVVGVPGRVVGDEGATTRSLLDHAALPDPVAAVLEGLISEVERLRERLDRREAGAPPTHGKSPGTRS